MAIEYFRPAEPCTTDAQGFPQPQIVTWFHEGTGNGGYCWEIDFGGIGGGITGDTRKQCFENWLREYADETGAEFALIHSKSRQLALSF